MNLSYSIFDPTGNITALVETQTDPEQRRMIADRIMDVHPEVEQVGFVRFADRDADPFDTELQMAGGEFCGNASMCAAAFFQLRHSRNPAEGKVRLRVSGTPNPVNVSLQQQNDESFYASIHMPAAAGISYIEFRFNKITSVLPVVRMEGITHVIIQMDSPFWSMKTNHAAAEQTVAVWCKELAADGLGLMFLEINGDDHELTPLVYIPGSGTTFWENSCASGGTAVGIYLASKAVSPVRISLREPGGRHFVDSDPITGKTILSGMVRLVSEQRLVL